MAASRPVPYACVAWAKPGSRSWRLLRRIAKAKGLTQAEFDVVLSRHGLPPRNL